ncbi:DNA-directed RNA polymerase III subunit RPC7-like [Mactra antiquata]
MAGRGRGRGKTVSFDVQALGFGRGEALPAANFQPPPLFPTQEFKPIPLDQNEDNAYLLALKQEFVAAIRKSPYYLKLDDRKRDIERYSDKYQLSSTDSSEAFEPDWRRLPSELKIKKRKNRKVSAIKPNLVARKKNAVKTEPDIDEKEIAKTLESLEKREETGVVDGEEMIGVKIEQEDDDDDENKAGGDDDNEEDIEGEYYDEDDLEEETDYAFNYFDNGEAYGDDDGDDDEGPVY